MARLLVRWGDDRAMTDDRLRADVAALGADVLEEILGILARGRYPAPPVEKRPAVYTLDPRQRTALSEAVADMPRAAVRHTLQGVAGVTSAEHVRVAALELCAEWAGPDDVSLVLALADPGEGRLPRSVRRALETALARLLEREREAAATLRGLSRDLSLEPLLCVARVLGRHGSAKDVEHLADVARHTPDAASVAVTEIGRLAARHPAPFPDGAASVLRDRLHFASAHELAQTIQVVGRLEDAVAVPLLLPLLEHEQRAVREEAHGALVSICREPLPPDAALWRRWYAEELAWWDRAATDLRADLWSGDAVREARAIQDLAAHELFRHETAAWLGEYLQSAPHELATLACAALGHLRSGSAVPYLRSASERPEPLVRDAAGESLRAIVGPSPGASTF